MNEQRVPYFTHSAPAEIQIKIEYTNDAPDVRQWLIDLKRDLLRKVRNIDELLATLPVDKS